MKKKLIIMGICVVVLLLIFVGNVYNRIKSGKEGHLSEQDIILRIGDMMTVEESMNLLSYYGIEVDKLANDTRTLLETEQEYLQFGDCLTLFRFICTELGLEEDNILKKLTFNMESEPANKIVLTEEFLSLYEGLMEELGTEASPVLLKTMYVIGSMVDEFDTSDANQLMVTDQGNYSFVNAASYERFYTNDANTNVFQLETYIDQKITAMVSGSDLLYVKSIVNEETTLHNVWITSGYETKVSAFLSNIPKEFEAKHDLSQKIEKQIGDLVIKDGKVIKISIKPDVIGGKVLVATQEYIEVEGYGKIPLDDNYKIYKVYGELSTEVTNSILVGYAATDFVVADGRIVAALIKETINARNIRALLKTNNFENIFHQQVTLSSDRDYIVTIGEKKNKYKKGTELTLNQGDAMLSKGRIQVRTVSETGKIKVLSLNRAGGVPAYRGTLEISATEEGLIIVNELPIEEYLYAVLPSEMPTSYNIEALKAQAICARSYAYNQLFANGYSEYGAHVDDSVSYQVYNNIPEDENSVLAVKDTYGKVINYNNSVITAFYFSTSCGHTSSINEVWNNATKEDYLVGKLQTMEEKAKSGVLSAASQIEDTNFSKESEFRKFILNPEKPTYESEFSWYRWKVTLSMADLKASIDRNIAQRYKANPLLIQTLVKGSNGQADYYESKPISSIGTVKEIKIGKREKSGVLSELILLGSEGTVKVISEYNIRLLLAPLEKNVIRQDKSVAENLKMLPSAYFVMDKKGKNVVLQGGGYGHGVGLSQNGAKAMADIGKSFDEIIKHYYTGVELGFIY